MRNKETFLFISYVNSVQLTTNQLFKNRRIKLIDKYILQVALISALFLVMKIGAEALAETILRLR